MEAQINTHFSDQFREARLLLIADDSDETATQLEQTSLKFSAMYDRLVTITTLMVNLRQECQNKATEIREETELKRKFDEKSGDKIPFVFRGRHANMSWGDMTDLDDRRNAIIEQAEQTEIMLQTLSAAPIEKKAPSPPTAKCAAAPEPTYKTMDKLDGIRLPKELSIRMIANLDELSPALAWYNGDKKHKPGIYIRLPQNLFIRIPFPDVIDSTQNHMRNKTIKCKYEAEDQCVANRKFLADKYNTDMRDCLFAHRGDTYTKVGTNFRCPANPRFGNHSYIKTDVESLKADDIKPVLMYALSDLLTCFIWNDFHHSNDKIIFSDVEVCQ